MIPRGHLDCADLCCSIVDENLFYKGVDKSAVSPARLQQSHSLAEPLLDAPSLEGPSGTSTAPETDNTEDVQPFHPFTSGDSLLGLTRKHNVRFSIAYASICAGLIPSANS